MMTSKLYGDNRLHRGRLARALDNLFRRLSDAYERMLRRVVKRPLLVIASALLIFITSLSMINYLPVEFMPREDRGYAMIRMTAPDGASLDYTVGYIKQIEQIVLHDKEKGDVLRVLSRSGSFGPGSDVNAAFFFTPLEVWSRRDRSAQEITQTEHGE